MLSFLRTDASHEQYKLLVNALDQEIQKRDGEDFGFYNQFNGSENINEVILALNQNEAVSCGTIKKFDANTAEVKRMFTTPEWRGKGIATQILDELVKWAKELDYKALILETGKKYPEAISLYRKYGFVQTESYGPYIGVDESVCFRLKIK